MILGYIFIIRVVYDIVLLLSIKTRIAAHSRLYDLFLGDKIMHYYDHKALN